MTSQNPEDWKFSLSNDPIQHFQPSTSRWHLRDEEEPSEQYIQPRLDSDPRQLPLTSLTSLQPDARVLIIVSEAKTMLIGSQ
jgi:hypothetical protein